MSNRMEDATQRFQRNLATFFRARYPYLYVSTWEEIRILSLIRTVAKDANLIRTTRQVFVWSATEGVVGEEQKGIRETAPLKALEFLENYREPAIFVLKDFHVYLGDQGRQADTKLIRKLRDIAPSLIRSKSPKNVVFVSSKLVLPADLEKDVTIIDFDLPTFEEIGQKLQSIIREQGGRIQVNLNGEESERLAKAAVGLTLQEAENAFARAMVEGGKLEGKSVELILEEKRQIIKKMEILEFIPASYKIDEVGGLENLKRWLRKRNKSWVDSAIARYGLESPKGVLITGIPGCGKSLIAKAISAMWQLPLLRLDVGRIFSGLVGSSEENMRRAIKTAEAIAPSILWIDEIEKGFGTTSDRDSGTSMRVFST
ncbi:MAG: AAA family ATPase, partial [Phormidesmis sp.]